MMKVESHELIFEKYSIPVKSQLIINYINAYDFNDI